MYMYVRIQIRYVYTKILKSVEWHNSEGIKNSESLKVLAKHSLTQRVRGKDIRTYLCIKRHCIPSSHAYIMKYRKAVTKQQQVH